MVAEYTESIFGSCMKYNPLRANCKELAVNIYKLKNDLLGLNDTEAMEKENAVNECYQIFIQVLDYAMGYERGEADEGNQGSMD